MADNENGQEKTEQPSAKRLDDADLVITLGFDMVEYHPHLWNGDKANKIIQPFFWPAIVRATGADWEVIRGLLVRGGRTRTRAPSPLGSWELLDFRRLVRELND